MSDLAESIADVMGEIRLDGGCGYWHSCTGCHESEDGHSIGRYPHSEAFGCALGAGCHECGGIGAVWQYHSASELRDMQNQHFSETRAERIGRRHGIFIGKWFRWFFPAYWRAFSTGTKAR